MTTGPVSRAKGMEKPAGVRCGDIVGQTEKPLAMLFIDEPCRGMIDPTCRIKYISYTVGQIEAPVKICLATEDGRLKEGYYSDFVVSHLQSLNEITGQVVLRFENEPRAKVWRDKFPPPAKKTKKTKGRARQPVGSVGQKLVAIPL